MSTEENQLGATHRIPVGNDNTSDESFEAMLKHSIYRGMDSHQSDLEKNTLVQQ